MKGNEKTCFRHDIEKLKYLQGSKIFKLHLSLWAGNSQILLARGSSPLGQVFQTLIIHVPLKWELFIGVFELNNLSALLVMFLVLTSFICCFLNYAPGILKIVESMFSIRGTRLCAIPWLLNCILLNLKKSLWREAHKIWNKNN